MGPEGLPDTKTGRPTDRRSHQLRIIIIIDRLRELLLL
jgi:hypothetical protein